MLVAGGKGLRMGSAIPKQFLPLAGKPVLYYCVKAFLDVFPELKIILVLPQEHISYSNILLQAFESRIDFIKGFVSDSRLYTRLSSVFLFVSLLIF